jgi:3-oxoacyl-[acyl-carrier-protein] synthase-1
MEQTSKQGAWIAGIGMMTAVGDCAAQTATSVRAGVSRYQESPMFNRRSAPMIQALLPEEALPPLKDEIAAMPGLTSRQIRLLRLAGPAVQEATQTCPLDGPIPLFLSTPEILPGHSQVISPSFFDYLEAQAEIQIDRPECRGVATGRAGGLHLLQAALACLSKGKHDYVLLGGVDTYFSLSLLAELDGEDRVLADGVMDGFCPGEGAGFILLCSNRVRDAHPPQPRVWVHPPGIANEPGHRYSDRPYLGEGLSSAIGQAVMAMEDKKIGTVYSTLNGENFGAKEWGVSLMRNSDAFKEDHRLEHPADCYGDIGSASATVLMGLAAMELGKARAMDSALVYCSSEQALRSAACLEKL